ncbi:hypothetical protein [Desulfocurvibacter africanus]|uniref:hypothetical protein n=1 Tax=Desulfocurvibacter africanus TaxID=873 RepID=UPI000404FF6A|nr:hypothetical protein [Desulfocurvibacter africanus]
MDTNQSAHRSAEQAFRVLRFKLQKPRQVISIGRSGQFLGMDYVKLRPIPSLADVSQPGGAMASLMLLDDLLKLLGFFDLRPVLQDTGNSGGEERCLLVCCPACGRQFNVEILQFPNEIVFNHEDLLCPSECNASKVRIADYHEQKEFERLEEFFASEARAAGAARCDDLLPLRKRLMEN